MSDINNPLMCLSLKDEENPSSSASSVDTVRPSSSDRATANVWSNFFAQELFLEFVDQGQKAVYHVYLTPPANPELDVLFITHHGAGTSGMSFALFAREISKILPNAGVLSLEARGHGSIVTDTYGNDIVDFSLPVMTADALRMIKLTQQNFGWSNLPNSVLVGHSLGGAICTQLAVDCALGNALVGYSNIDIVEGSAIEALQYMNTYLKTRPSAFNSVDEAINWHLSRHTLRNRESAEVSVPSLLAQANDGKWVWRTNIGATAPWWESWFKGLSKKFLQGRGAKQLILAGTDRLDKELLIGQMQGKFQLVVLPEAGHFVQEDAPEKTAQLLVEFFKRNDSSSLVLPPKISDMIAQGIKV
ncbi:protein phosphatase methylesterase [Piedraia hortae CBS 480.64]|uniref:Protein phosphatase methylesterase 1 n=1 Tax=Piedraia hortae CBS 480.64 TaxID=1314780 RepID=A0A6A7BUA0_9PEZI|nr:protein phosphatase methylesterase [Piedraia hortae CBS 480.64]